MVPGHEAIREPVDLESKEVFYTIVADGRKSSKLTACKSPGSNIQKIRGMVFMVFT
jgi:hypothetical protein